jgi:translocation and assembly module TamB
MRVFRILGIVLAGVLGLLVLAFGFLQTPPGQRMLVGLVSGKSLQISGLSGFFPTDLQVARIELLDSQGSWLRIENARLRWSLASLLDGRVRVELLAASLVDVERAPVADKADETSSSGSFRLPLGVELQAFAIDTLHVARPLAEVDSRWRLQGNGLLSADLHEGHLVLAGDRQDGPSGKLAADVHFDLVQATVDGQVALEEGQGGVMAALLQRPDLDRVSLKLVAKGAAAAGEGTLTLAAGDAATATGNARWQPAGSGTAVSVRLDAAGTQVVKRGGPVQLTADATLDDATATLTTATLNAGPLTLSASGRYGRQSGHLDGNATVRLSGPGALAPYVEGVSWRDLELSAHAVLDDLIKQPRGSLSFNGSAAELVVAALEGSLPPLGRVAFNGELGLKDDGSLTVQSLQVTSALASLSASDGSFVPKTEAAEVKATIDVPSLTPFSKLAGRELAGRGHVDLSVRSDPSQGLTVSWQGTLADAGAPGVPPGLIAREVRLSGSGTRAADERWSLSDVRVASEAGSFGLNARGQGSSGRFDLVVELRRLGILRGGLDGDAKVNATIELRTDGTAGGSVTASGAAQGQPLSLSGRFERDAAGGIVVPSFEGHWASAVLHVADLAITPDRTTGSARLQVERLQEVGALVGTEMAGSVEADISTDPQLAQGRLKVRVQVREAKSSGVAVAGLQADATIDDPMGTATADAKIVANGLRGAGDFSRLNVTVKGNQQSGLDLALQASGGQSDLNLAAKVELGESIRIALSRLDGRQQGIAISLAAPTHLAIAGAQVRIDPTNLRLGGGRLAVQGLVDPAATNLTLDLAGLPLSLIDTLAPGTGVDGTLQARARVSGPSGNPRIEATYSAAGVRLRRPEAALLPALAVQGTAAIADRNATFDARLGAGAGTNLVLKGRMAMASMTGTANVTGTLDLAPFAPLIGNQVRGVAGTLRSDLTIDIARDRVTGRGTLDLVNAALNLPDAGMRLSGGSAHLVLQGDTLQLQRLAFQTGGNGGVTSSGTLRLDPGQGMVLDLSVGSRRALLVSRPDLVATVSSDLKITGATGSGIDVKGPITVDRAEISIGAGETASFPTLEVREINRPVDPKAPPPPPARRAPPPRDSSGMPIRLALVIHAPQAVFVRGRGLDAEMSGDLQVNGDPARPAVSGGLTMRRGSFSLAGRRLVFNRGVVTLDNLDRIDPRLDFVANTTVQSTTIMLAIRGTSREPEISVTSSPPLPQDEAFALLLFGKPASGLSAMELVSMGESIAELTGRGGTSGPLGRLRQTLGLDQLRVGSSDSRSSSSPVSVEAGRYVAPGVYVGAKQGAAGNSSRGVVEIQVLRNTKIEGDIGADSNGRIGVKMEWDY